MQGAMSRGRQGGGRGRARLGIREDDGASGAALGAAVIRARLDKRVALQAHKMRQAWRVARPAPAWAGGAVVRVREVSLEIIEANRAVKQL